LQRFHGRDARATRSHGLQSEARGRKAAVKKSLLAAAFVVMPGIALLTAVSAQTKPANPAGVEFFEKKIRPLLAAECYSCHSAASKPLMGGLRLDTKAGMLAGGSHGAAIVAGQPDKSVLINAVRFTGSLQMPPKGKLSESQIAAFTEWVKMGAPDPRESSGGAKKLHGLSVEDGRKHWAFLPLKHPTPPVLTKLTPPLQSWSRTPVDRFILAKLVQKGLTPNPIADRRTLIRRAYFDLIGLPPTPEEVTAFINDKSPGAYGKVIDHLLESPHYGERWGRHWLDLARFAESHGFEHDYDRPNAYHFRDFVIKALNQDLPYNQFVQWQLAGDEIEPENPLALMATGFLAAGVHSTQITKNQVEKERYDELDDMLSTTSTAFLGLTVGCARCHYHKYDPIPNQDYYRMLSTFTTTVRSDYDVNMDPAGYRSAKESFDRAHAPLVAARTRFEQDVLPQRLDSWLKNPDRAKDHVSWQFVQISEAKSAGGATFTLQEDGSYLATGKNPDNDTYTFVAKTGLQGITAVRLDALKDPSFVKAGPGRAANGNFALTDFKVTAAPVGGGKPIEITLARARADFEQKGLPINAAIDADAKSAWAVDPEFGKDHTAVFELENPVGFEGGSTLTFTLKFDNNTQHSIGRPRLSVTTEAQPVALKAAARPERLERILSAAGSGVKPTGDDLQELLKWYRTLDPEWQTLNKQVAEHLAQEPKLPIQKVLISSEGVPAVRLHTQGDDFLKVTHFLNRGDPNLKEAVVSQGFLQVLERTPEGEKHWQVQPPKDWRTSYRRRSLANWITDPDTGAGHLLARVIMNRLWQHHLGRGIVATPSDFGTQGERPTHPELLDYLASELIRGGWKLKAVHKLIMTSAVYMQTSDPNPVCAKADPANKLLWRHRRTRLEAEVIRDAMLAVSGTLDATMYGPGTLEESQKRRSIYFTVKRSKLIPTMQIFDAPDALQALAVRSTTTVAPQALMLMNNMNIREYAHNLAVRVAPKQDTPPTEAVKSAYMLALGRQPDRQELKDTMDFIMQQWRAYTRAGKGSSGYSLAVTDFCQALMGLNEFVYMD
jgi:mono/diheme cytochrome c family protein